MRSTLRELVTRLRFSYRGRDRQLLARYDRDTGRIRRGTRRLAAANTALAASNARVGASFAGVGRSLAGFGATLGVAFTGKAISDAGDALDDLENRIRAVEGADAPIRAVRRELTALSLANFSSLEDTAQIFQRFRIGTEDLGKSRSDIIAFTDLVQKAGITSGSSAQETNAALIQFAQGISSNRFSGEEFRSVAEQLPTILRVLKADLGLSTGQLREKAFAGELTADVIFGAFDRQQDQIRADFQNLQLTRGLGTAQLKTGFTTFFGAFAQGSGFNQDIAQLNSILGTFFTENELAARRWGRATRDAFTIAFDAIGSLFGNGGSFSGVGKFFNSFGQGLETGRRFLALYGNIRDRGGSAGKAFNVSLQTLFGEKAAERYAMIAQKLKPIGQAIATIFASRAIAGFVRLLAGLIRRFSPFAAAVAVVTVGVRAWNKENSNLRKLWERLSGLWDGDFGNAMRSLGQFVSNVLVVAFEVLIGTIDTLAGWMVKLIDLMDKFTNFDIGGSFSRVGSGLLQFSDVAAGLATGEIEDADGSKRRSLLALSSNPSLLVSTLSTIGAASSTSANTTVTQHFHGQTEAQRVGEETKRAVSEAILPLASGAN